MANEAIQFIEMSFIKQKRAKKKLLFNCRLNKLKEKCYKKEIFKTVYLLIHFQIKFTLQTNIFTIVVNNLQTF